MATPEKTGYDFVNWTENGIAVTEIPQGSYGDKTVTANWNVIVYTITYTGVAGAYDVDTPVNTNPTSYTIEDETITLVPASKTVSRRLHKEATATLRSPRYGKR